MRKPVFLSIHAGTALNWFLPRSVFNLGRGRWTGEGDLIIEHFLPGVASRFVDAFSFQGDTLVWQQEAPAYGYLSKLRGLMKQ